MPKPLEAIDLDALHTIKGGVDGAYSAAAPWSNRGFRQVDQSVAQRGGAAAPTPHAARGPGASSTPKPVPVA